MSGALRPPPALLTGPIVRRALEEDLGRGGDLTTDAIVMPDEWAEARIVAREAGRVAGLQIACSAFFLLDPDVSIDYAVEDGEDAAAGTTLATVGGRAAAILAGERTALNLLGRMCGIATLTARLVTAVAGTGAAVAETRKTTPGLRILEKYAVRCGGGSNHRFGLDDAVLVKDNHVALAGGVAEAVRRVRAAVGHMVTVEVEVDDLEQLAEAIDAGVDAVLLDNMGPGLLREAVAMVGGRVVTEASGGITPESVAEVAAAGVDVVSLGWLTHSVRALDVALDVVVPSEGPTPAGG
jgi:nicotinate-nucleotide pyrophosphorylase (carboxylating)